MTIHFMVILFCRLSHKKTFTYEDLDPRPLKEVGDLKLLVFINQIGYLNLWFLKVNSINLSPTPLGFTKAQKYYLFPGKNQLLKPLCLWGRGWESS